MENLILRIGITPDGVTLKAFEQLNVAIQTKVMKKALRAGARVVLPAVKDETPRGMTDKLYNAIGIRSLRKRSATEVAIAVTAGKKFFTGPSYYGGMVQFGHRLVISRGRNKGKATGKVIPANRFVNRGFDKTYVTAANIIMSTMVLSINQEVDIIGQKNKNDSRVIL